MAVIILEGIVAAVQQRVLQLQNLQATGSELRRGRGTGWFSKVSLEIELDLGFGCEITNAVGVLGAMCQAQHIS